MYKTTQKLHQDHENIARLLQLLEEQVDNLEVGEYTDIHLVSDIMRYFVNYPGLHHHPHENLIYDTLKRLDITTADEIDEIYGEHEKMESTSRKLLNEIIKIQGNAIYSREELVGQLRDYINIYLSHMDKEEKDLFPRARELLTEQDWQVIDKSIQNEDNLLFDKILKDEYGDLYQAIMSEAANKH